MRRGENQDENEEINIIVLLLFGFVSSKEFPDIRDRIQYT